MGVFIGGVSNDTNPTPFELAMLASQIREPESATGEHLRRAYQHWVAANNFLTEMEMRKFEHARDSWFYPKKSE